MKKNYLVVVVASLVVALFAGCGETDEVVENTAEAVTATPTPVEEEEVTEGLISLGEYKGIKVSYAEPVADEEEVMEYALQLFEANVTEDIGVKDRAVEEGDKIYLSYEGKIDGVAFDGGTSSGYWLEIGSGTFIPGFEDQLIGVMPGETVDVTVTFPENYSAEDLAGKEAVFTCEVFYIMPEMTDESIQGIEWDYEDLETLKNDCRNYILSMQADEINAQIQNDIVEQVMNNATFGELPSDLLEKYAANARNSIETYAAYSGVDADTYSNYYYGANEDEAVAHLSEEWAKQELVFKAIAEAEGLNLTDEEFEKRFEEYATSNGYESADDLIAAGAVKDTFREYFLFDDVIGFISDNAEVTKEN